MKQYIGISRDHSASMRSLARHAESDYNDNIAAIKAAAESNDIDTIVSTVKCGVGSRGSVEREVVNSNVTKLRPITKYAADGSSTPLFDSVGELIELLEKVPDSTDNEVSFLVMAITDGEENSSSRYTGNSLGEKIRRLQATDRWTFVFRVPTGYKRRLVGFGIPDGNIEEWEQTERGMRESSVHTQQAVSSYFVGRTKGVRSTDRFYADLSKVSRSEVKAVLTDISQEVLIWPVKNGGLQIRDFVENKLRHNMQIGAAFYLLTKPEKAVQEYKLICIRDKKTGAVYSGPSARDLLNLPHYGTIKLAPGDHGEYEIYIQSTSVNRKLIAGTTVLYWSKASAASV